MKKLILKGILATCMLLVCMVGKAQNATEPNGIWTFSCPDAPYEYQTGKMEFKKQNGKLTLAVVVNGKAGPAIDVTKKDKTYSCTLNVDGADVTLKVTGDGEGLKGSVFSDQWEMPISLKPEKK